MTNDNQVLPAANNSPVGVARLNQSLMQLLNLGPEIIFCHYFFGLTFAKSPVVALHDAFEDAVLGAHVDTVVPVAHQAPRPLLLLEPASLHEAPVTKGPFNREKTRQSILGSDRPAKYAQREPER